MRDFPFQRVLNLMACVTLPQLLPAQGADDCNLATPIAGVGQFAFDNTLATTDGPANCNAMSDVWFRWTAPGTGQFEMASCGLTSIDTVLGVYEGGICPATTELDCSDDVCNRQSVVTFDALMGQEYLLRVGGFNTWQGSGFIELRQIANGGANDCSAATPITGTGYFAWNSAGCTTDAPPACAPIFRDLWFLWTAPTTDIYRFSLCGKTRLDSVLAVYDGSVCPPGVALDCSDNACGQQSEVTLTVSAGASYLIAIGAAVDGETDHGHLGIFADACSSFSNDDPFEENDNCTLAVPLTSDLHSGLWCAKSDEDWYSVGVPAFGSVSFDALFAHASGDIDMELYADDCLQLLGASTSVDDNEHLDWLETNGLDTTLRLRVFFFSGSTSDCNTYDLLVVGPGGGIGTKYCVALANSTGAPADLSAAGSSSALAGDLVLSAAPVPNTTAIFFHGADQSQIPFGNGFLCTINDLVRSGVLHAANNTASYAYDNSDSKHSLQAFVGKRRNFQYWFRDPMAGGSSFNTSNAISLLILP